MGASSLRRVHPLIRYGFSFSLNPHFRDGNLQADLSVVARWLLGFALYRNPALHWRQRLAVSLLRAQRTTFPTRHLRWLSRRASTRDAIIAYCHQHGLTHSMVTLNAAPTEDAVAQLNIPGASLHFVTSLQTSDSGPTLLYFHGGGFVNPLRSAGHMPFILRCAAACRATQTLILEYALAPEHPYPAQLVQCVAALRHLLEDMNIDPGDIVLAGDSAGGLLVGAVLAHLARPSPHAPPLSLGGRRLKAALFVSPWAVLPSSRGGSYAANEGSDYLSRTQVDQARVAWNGKEDEIWANLYGVEEAGEVWDKIVPRGEQGLVQKIMVTAGTAEVFLDGCLAFARDGMRAETIAVARETDCDVLRGKTVVLAVCEGEVHVQPALDCAVAFDQGSMMRAITSWLATI